MGSNSKAVLTLRGFDDLLQQIQKASGSIDGAVIKATEKSAEVVAAELKAKAAAADVPESVINDITKEPVKMENNVVRGAVGWKLGAYNPRNLSKGYKALFLNYGAVRKDRGTIKARGFILAAKKSSKKKVKAVQQETFDEILKGLKKQ